GTPMSPPLTPDADQARQQLADELSNPIYADVGSWLSDQWNKLLDWLIGHPTSVGALSPQQLTVAVLTVAALAGLTIWVFRGPLRTERRRRAVFAEATDQDAAGLRAQAVQLAEAADWDAAVLALFRALVRSLSERGIIAEFPGMTAREASSRAAERLPDLAERLTRAATVFDSVAYGHNPGSAEQYRDLLALDAAVAATRPIAVAGTMATEVAGR
ncbi:MAG TPA: DUF4129 domain-containing protein, partial [Propionicimonas sp.]|nr:DUF4129 domain-containing protein [Propionicimonas sp.]